MILIIDNYDSFSYNLYQMIGETGTDLKVIRNDEMTVEEIRQLMPECIILSPGPGRCRCSYRCYKNNGKESPDSWRMPWTSGNMCGIWFKNNVCKRADAWEAVECNF